MSMMEWNSAYFFRIHSNHSLRTRISRLCNSFFISFKRLFRWQVFERPIPSDGNELVAMLSVRIHSHVCLRLWERQGKSPHVYHNQYPHPLLLHLGGRLDWMHRSCCLQSCYKRWIETVYLWKRPDSNIHRTIRKLSYAMKTPNPVSIHYSLLDTAHYYENAHRLMHFTTPIFQTLYAFESGW